MEQSIGLTVLYLMGVVIWIAFLSVVWIIKWKTPPKEDSKSS
jgi:hypothetical protein